MKKVSESKPTRSRATTVAVAVSLLIAALVGVAVYRDETPADRVTLAPTRMPSPLAVGNEPAAQPAARAPSMVVMPAKPAAEPAPIAPSRYPLEDQFRRLMASADPGDNARGYLMAWECANEAENVRMNVIPVDPQCGLAPGTWQDAEARKKGVTAAAQLGRPNGWAYLLLEEGPGGRLAAFSEAERPEWERLVAETYPIALDAKDSAALGHEAVLQESAGNYARAAELYVACAAALARRTNQPYVQPEESLAPLRSKLSAADLNHAIVEGRKMAETVKAGELL